MATRLSPDQEQVLSLLARGLSADEICRQLDWRPSRYQGAVASAQIRLGAKNLLHAVALAVKAGLIE
jgi:DNA-binding CsgD family transcriptional regulator